MCMDCYTVSSFWIGLAGLAVSIVGLVISIMVNVKAGRIETALDDKILQLTTFEHVPKELEKLEAIRNYFKTDNPVYWNLGFDDLYESISMLDALKAQLSKRSKTVYNEIEDIKKVGRPTQKNERAQAIESIKPHLDSLIAQLKIEVSKYEKR